MDAKRMNGELAPQRSVDWSQGVAVEGALLTHRQKAPWSAYPRRRAQQLWDSSLCFPDLASYNHFGLQVCLQPQAL